jgi:hypothetical protein
MTAQELRDEGWTSIDERLPPGGVTVEFARDEAVHRQPQWFGQWNQLPPAFNVAGLWWRRP